MAFIKDQTTSANAAVMTAGNIVAASITRGIVKTTDEAAEAAQVIFDALFSKLQPVVEADNVLFLAEAAAAPAKTAAPRKTTTSSSKSSGGGGNFTADAARDLALNSGPFKGCTIGEVSEMDAEEAGSYNYKRGSGADYVQFLSTDDNPNEYTRKMAAALLAA